MMVGIVDPHPLHTEGVKALLSFSDRFEVVAIGTATRDIAAICVRSRPDLLVVEICMVGDPLQEILLVSRKFPQTKAIVLTSMEDAATIRRALACRARGYVLKRTADEDLIKAFDAASVQAVYVSPPAVSSLLCIGGRDSVI